MGLLEVFYDSACPLCAAEMMHLKQLDQNNLIVLVDLHSDNLSENYPSINFDKAMRILHGYYNGKVLLGLEVTHQAWTLVGKGVWVAPLNWPLIKPISHAVYLIVAKFRRPISSFISKLFNLKTADCSSGVCNGKNNDINNRSK